MMIKRYFLARFIILLGMAIVIPPTAYAVEPNGKINAVLSDMEGHAEDMVDAALAKNRMRELKLYKVYKEINRELGHLHAIVGNQPFDERRSRELVMAYSWLRVIAIDVKQDVWIGAAIAANQLDGSIIRFAQFPTLRERDIAWLDYLGREVLLLTIESPKVNAELLGVRRSELADTWHRTRKNLIEKDFRNKTLTMKGNGLVTKIEHEHDPTQSINLARQWLDFVDQLEKTK